jgi:hypothetical protein
VSIRNVVAKRQIKQSFSSSPPRLCHFASFARRFLSIATPLIGRVVTVGTRHPLIIALAAAFITAADGMYMASISP